MLSGRESHLNFGHMDREEPAVDTLSFEANFIKLEFKIRLRMVFIHVIVESVWTT